VSERSEGIVASWRTSKGNAAMATRFLWRVFAPFEFVVTVLVGLLLYLGGALCFAACVFLKEWGGLFERAVVLAAHRFRGPILNSANERVGAPSLPTKSARVPVGSGRLSSWLN
jgi:hypothetical protein